MVVEPTPSQPHDPIMVVDDDPVCCRLLATMLELGGYRVEWTTDATLALGRVLERPYALVLADVQMPEMPGTTLAAEIALQRPGLPTVLVSAFADRRARAQAQALGAELIAKPVRSDTLLATVRELLYQPGRCASTS
jgi:CheY-like chemotaxis protein